MSNNSNDDEINMIRSKIGEYTGFIDNVLMPEKYKLESELFKIQTEINEYNDLQNDLSKTTATATATNMTSSYVVDVDLGYETIYCNAVVDVSSSSSEGNNNNHENIFVHVGMGFHIEFNTSVEAIEFIKKRISYLQDGPLNQKQQKILEVTSHIESSKQILYQLDHEIQQMS